MRVTLLGSGDAVGVPAPLCDCEYCQRSPRRRRPGLLVETDEATVVLDAGPDLTEQLHATDTAAVDACFVTHHHYDHVGGLHELCHAAMGFDAHVGAERLPEGTFAADEKPADPAFDLYLTETARGHVADANPHLLSTLDTRTLEHGAAVDVGDCRVVPFPVEHARPEFDTVGFAVHHAGSTVVYAPDMWEFVAETTPVDADLLFAEGAALFRAFGHGDEDDLRASLAAADAKRTVLVNLNEHLQRQHTDELRAVASRDGYELGSDFAEYTLAD
jgi:phosphoribosyl 1,2-cyclic phosphate phosphodiesterase